MRSRRLKAAVALAVTLGLAASIAFSQNALASGKIGPSAAWQPPQDFITKAHAACDQSHPPNYAECFIDQMSKLGAPADAVSFTRMLYKQNDGDVGIMTELHKVGPVDEARVLYPLRANDNYGILLVNGDPAILNVDDLKKLDRAAMEQNPSYQSVKQKYPKTDIWPGDRSGNTWPQPKPLPDGGVQIHRRLSAAERMPRLRAHRIGQVFLGLRCQGKVPRHEIHTLAAAAKTDAP